MKAILFALLLLSTQNAFAHRYYLSNQGNDSLNGTSETSAWRTLRKLAESMPTINRGDSILLHRGSIFHGVLNLTASGLYVGAYGTGDQPILSGSVKTTGWKKLKPHIWSTPCPDSTAQVMMLLDNNRRQRMGRYPNTGFLPYTIIEGEGQSLADKSTSFPLQYWRGAELVVRTSRWTIDRLPIIDNQAGKFSFEIPPSYHLQNGFGYFIQNHPATLDQQGEWYHDQANEQVLYFSNEDPNLRAIEISKQPVGVYANAVAGLTIENLTFQNYQVAGVLIENSSDVRIHQVIIYSSGRNGLEIINCDGPLIEESQILRSQNIGVLWTNNTNGAFLNNTIIGTGLISGAADSGNGTQIGMLINGEHSDKNIVDHNRIDSTGYHGIDFRTRNTLISSNEISNFCLTKDDGAGIYTWHNTGGGNVIQDNQIKNGRGNGEGTPHENERYASGVYLDDLSSHILVKNNHIENCSVSGVFLHNATAITIVGNTVSNNGTIISNQEKGQLYIRIDSIGLEKMAMPYQLEILQNSWSTTSDASHCLFIRSIGALKISSLGKFEQNTFCAPNYKLAIAHRTYFSGRCEATTLYTLANWQAEFLQEDRSLFQLQGGAPYFTSVGRNLIENESMTISSNGWASWPSMKSIEHDAENLIYGPSLKISNLPGGNSEVLVYHAGFALEKTKTYRLTLSTMSEDGGWIEFTPMMANEPWRSLGRSVCFEVDKTHNSFTYFFQPDRSSHTARINFKANSTFWLDEVSLYEVTTEKKGLLSTGSN